MNRHPQPDGCGCLCLQSRVMHCDRHSEQHVQTLHVRLDELEALVQQRGLRIVPPYGAMSLAAFERMAELHELLDGERRRLVDLARERLRTRMRQHSAILFGSAVGGVLGIAIGRFLL